MNTKDLTQKKWLISAFICIILAIFLLIGSFTFLKDAHNVDTNVSFNGQAYLSFSTNYATAGEPLSVFLNGADDTDAVYEWVVGGKNINNSTSTYTPTEDDLEKFITVTVTYDKTKALSASLYCSKLPVIYLNTTDDIGEEYVAGTWAMQGNKDYTYASTEFYFGDVYVKLRGNSTKYRPKAPYKVKLAEAANLFNMGSSKHWVLLANDIDHTFVRNKLVYDFSATIGADYATESLNVVLVLNNEYQGVYQLCEQPRVDEERIDIYDWENLAEEAATLITETKAQSEGMSDNAKALMLKELKYALSTDLSWITAPYTYTFNGVKYKIDDYVDIPDVTGGFLLEMDFYNLGNPDGLVTYNQQPFYFNTPEYGYTNPTLKTYAYKYIQSFEFALHSADHTFHADATHYSSHGFYFDRNDGWVGGSSPVFYTAKEHDGLHYSELFDMNSLLVNCFVCEFSMNWDSMKNSVFVSKDIDGLASLSPAWDFDWAFGNYNMFNIDTYYPESWHTTNDYFTNEQYYQSVQWNRFLVRDPYFLYQAYLKYKEIRPTVIEDIIKDGGLLDYYEDLYAEAGVANDSLWHKTYIGYNGESFANSMESLRTFIETRVAWMDEQFESFETYLESVDYYEANDNISVTAKYNDDGTVTLEASSSEYTDYIVFQINGTTTKQVFCGTDGIARITVEQSSLEEKDKNIVEIHGMNQSEKYIDGLHNYLIF